MAGFAAVPFTCAHAMSASSLKVAAPLGVLAVHVYAFRLDDVQRWALRRPTRAVRGTSAAMSAATLVAVRGRAVVVRPSRHGLRRAVRSGGASAPVGSEPARRSDAARTSHRAVAPDRPAAPRPSRRTARRGDSGAPGRPSRRLRGPRSSAADAEATARRAFGGVDQAKARYRDQRGWPWLDALTQDLRFAGRYLLRDRAFAVPVVLVLALGIGVGHMFLTLTYAHVLRGLPIEDVERVFSVSTLDARGAARGVSYPDFIDVRATQRSFADLAAYANAPLTLGDEGQVPDRALGAFTTASGFLVAGVRPLARPRLLGGRRCSRGGGDDRADRARLAEPLPRRCQRDWPRRAGEWHSHRGDRRRLRPIGVPERGRRVPAAGRLLRRGRRRA